MLYIKSYLQYAGLIPCETKILDERFPNAQKNLSLPPNQNKHIHKQQQ